MSLALGLKKSPVQGMDADQAGTKNVYKVTGNHLDFCRVRLEVCF